MTFSPYLAHTQNVFIQLNTLSIRKLVLHRTAIQMCKYNIGIITDVINSFYVANSDVYSCNTRNINKTRSAFSGHKHIYRIFRFISIDI